MVLEFLNEPVSKFTNPKLTTVSSDLTVRDTAKVMLDSKIDSVLVFEHGQIIGIVTEKDILDEIVAKGLDPAKTIIKKITKGPLLTIKKDATVKEALTIMKKNDVRRLVVMDKRPVGLITQKQVCGNLEENYLLLPELETAKEIRCPYCSSISEDKKSLSKHIDDIHIGRGLLEGDLRKMD